VPAKGRGKGRSGGKPAPGPAPAAAEPSVDPLEGLFESFPSEVHEILREMFSEEHLEKKTELTRPLNWSVMSSIEEFLREHELPRSASILSRFIRTSFRYLISHSRKGREEYVEALRQASLTQREEVSPAPPG